MKKGVEGMTKDISRMQMSLYNATSTHGKYTWKNLAFHSSLFVLNDYCY